MKKLVIILLFLGVSSWAVYDFVFPLNESKSTEDIELEHSESEVIESVTENEDDEIDLSPSIGLEVGDLAPDFSLDTLNGEEVSLSDYQGGPVMINFWATWCPPCRAEMPDMEKFYQDSDIEILAVNLTETEQTIEQVHDFVEDYQLTFPILLDDVIEVAMLYAIQPIPTSLMINSEGIIEFKTYGPLTYDQMVQVRKNIN